MVKIVVDCKRGQIGLVSLVVCIVVIDGIWTKSSLFTPLGRSKSLWFVRPILERAIPVWNPGITCHQINRLEKI